MKFDYEIDCDCSLVEYFKKLRSLQDPADRLIEQLSKKTHRKPNTVQGWASGKYPDELAMTIIAQHIGADVNTLFPPKSNYYCPLNHKAVSPTF